MNVEAPSETTKRLESLAFGAPAAEVARLVQRDGAVILRDVLNAGQVTRRSMHRDMDNYPVFRRYGPDTRPR